MGRFAAFGPIISWWAHFRYLISIRNLVNLPYSNKLFIHWNRFFIINLTAFSSKKRVWKLLVVLFAKNLEGRSWTIKRDQNFRLGRGKDLIIKYLHWNSYLFFYIFDKKIKIKANLFDYFGEGCFKQGNVSVTLFRHF